MDFEGNSNQEMADTESQSAGATPTLPTAEVTTPTNSNEDQTISVNGAIRFMELLFERGYFQKDVNPIKTSIYATKHDFHEKSILLSQSYQGFLEPSSYDDDNSKLIPLRRFPSNTKSDDDNDVAIFSSIEILAGHLVQLLKEHGGRISLQFAASELRVSMPTIVRNVLKEMIIQQLKHQHSIADPAAKDNIIVVNGDRCFPNVSLSADESLTEEDPITLIGSLDTFLLSLRENSIITTNKYWIDQTYFLRKSLNAEMNGCVKLSYVSEHIFQKISSAVIYPILHYCFKRLPNEIDATEKLSNNVQFKSLDKAGSYLIVTDKFVHDFQDKVNKTFTCIINEKVSVTQIALLNDWDRSWVSDIVKESCTKNIIPGILHGDIYIPKQYTEHQSRILWDEYRTTGYITNNFVQNRLDITFTQATEYLLLHCKKEETKQSSNTIETEPVVTQCTLFHPIITVAPLIAAIEDACMKSSWTNLKDHISAELLEEQCDDIRFLVNDIILPTDNYTKIREKVMCHGEGFDSSVTQSSIDDQVTQLNGIACIQSNGALFVSSRMIQAFSVNEIPQIIQSYAKIKAKEYFDRQQDAIKSTAVTHVSIEENEEISAKEKSKLRKERKTGKQTRQIGGDQECTQWMRDPFPIIIIVTALVTSFPELSEVLSSQRNADWKTNLTDENNILSSFCEQAFYSDKTEGKLKSLIQSELEKLNETNVKKLKQVSSVDPLTMSVKVRSIEGAYEDPKCFASCCYMIQSIHKFMEYIQENLNDTSAVEGIKKEFLVGYCADFTRRVTEYCLYRNQIEENLFIFSQPKDDDLNNNGPSLPLFYSAIDTTIRRYPSICLLTLGPCNENLVKSKNPLLILRDILPGSKGVLLAQQWKLCGGECYDNGSKVVESGNLEKFLQHVNENCLSICGLPFAKLDKKSEKKLLTDRRQQLINQLEEATDPEIVLDLLIMVLYQLVKNMIVLGSYLRGPILNMLLNEKKVSDKVKEDLIRLSDMISSGQPVEIQFLDDLKQSCLAKKK